MDDAREDDGWKETSRRIRNTVEFLRRVEEEKTGKEVILNQKEIETLFGIQTVFTGDRNGRRLAA